MTAQGFLLAVVVSCVFTGACAVPAMRIPITLRSLSIKAASIDTPNEHKELSKTQLMELEHKLTRRVLADLLASGPFRAPLPSEASYEVYVDLRKMTAGYQAESEDLKSAIRKFAGLPIGYVSMSGFAIFQIFAPDKNTLVHETVTQLEHESSISIYRGKRYGFEDVTSNLVDALKQHASRRQHSILTKNRVDSVQKIEKSIKEYEIQPDGKIIYYYNVTGSTQINHMCGDKAKIQQNNAPANRDNSSNQLREDTLKNRPANIHSKDDTIRIVD
ncbi:MAG: hypothetical protein JNJ46_25460 [Myxococcales bacterium]|nr:hypothetical protein [Myxococcales bacterium]